MNKSKRQDVSESSFCSVDKNEDDHKDAFNKDMKDVKEDIQDDEVQLRKHSRPYKSIFRSRKSAISTTTINSLPTSPSVITTLPNPLTTSSGRSKSLSWHRTSNVLYPQFGNNIFSRKGSRHQRKYSAPIESISLSRNRQRKR